MTEDFRFKKWPVYQDSKILFREVNNLVTQFPSQYRYSLSDQLLRSALSVLLNIAEGSGKRSDRELNRFFNIALGSLHEISAVLDAAKDAKLISPEGAGKINNSCVDIARQLSGFKKHLKK